MPDLLFLTPIGALVAVAAVLPLAAAWLRERRLARVRTTLGLAPPRRLAALSGALAAAAGIALLGLAAAQPAVARTGGIRVRTDAEGYLVLDNSRSMEAVARRGGPTRLARARALALRLRDAVPELPWGVASFNDRTLVHAFPSPERALVADTLAQSVGIQRPPPFFTEQTATALGTLVQAAGGGFFPPRIRERVLVLFTDGESRPFVARALVQSLHRARIRLVVVRLWSPGDRVYDGRGRDLGYRPDPASAALLRQLPPLGVPVVPARDPGRLPALVRGEIGHGPTVAPSAGPRLTPLAPAAVIAACFPLGFALLRTRR